MSRYVVCADVGSTYTKACLVDLGAGRLVATAERPTTVDADVLAGLDAAVAAAGAPAGVPWYVCSSAGGGLRLAVVGFEELVTAEAGHRVGLSAGARVVHVAAGPLDAAAVAALRADRPDVVLLVGGTDGGDADVLRHNAARLASARLRVPVVVAGNAEARDDAVAALAARSVPVTATANVLPRIGVLDAPPARAAIREVFLRHVIGGKRLSRGRRFPALVRCATPDAVLAAVELLADDTGYGMLAVDVGGATTDVYSALPPDPERRAGPRQDVAGTLWRARTVEGDLGVRAGASGVVAAATAERLLPADDPLSTVAAARTAGRPAGRPAGPSAVLDAAEAGADRRLAELAATIAVRRHARGSGGTHAGRDLRDVRLVIGSGGVLRHGGGPAVVAAVLTDVAGGWAVPTAAEPVIDVDYVLAAAGLLAGDRPGSAVALLHHHLGLR